MFAKMVSTLLNWSCKPTNQKSKNALLEHFELLILYICFWPKNIAIPIQINVIKTNLNVWFSYTRYLILKFFKINNKIDDTQVYWVSIYLVINSLKHITYIRIDGWANFIIIINHGSWKNIILSLVFFKYA